MPTPTTITWPVTAFINNACDVAALEHQIRSSPDVVVAIAGVSQAKDGSVSATFRDLLDEGSKTALDGDPSPAPSDTPAAGTLIHDHDGQPMPVYDVDEEGTPLVQVKGPHDKDGKQLITVTPRKATMQTWFHGSGDTAPDGRGQGAPMSVSLEGGDEGQVEYQYLEPVWLHDGGVRWNEGGGWGPDDYFELSLKMPATPIAPNGGGTGNANLVDGVIVPAAGDGGFDVDLSTAVPVPVENAAAPDGFWEVSDETGEVTLSPTPGAAPYHLVAAALELFLMRAMPMIGTPHSFEIEAYEVKMVHQTWVVCFKVTKASAGAGHVRGWLLGFRRKVM